MRPEAGAGRLLAASPKSNWHNFCTCPVSLLKGMLPEKIDMNRRIGFRMQSGLLSLALGSIVWLTTALSTCAAVETTFPLLEIGAHTYTNVTVTTKAKSYVFIIHSQGMTNLKVADLPPDVLEVLGYDNPNVPKVATNGPAVWAKQTIAKLDTPEVKEVQQELTTKWNASPAGAQFPVPEITRTLLLQIAGVILALYLFQCFCFMLICRKANSRPGLLVWLPILQVFPMLKAARMSGWWFLALCVPVLNLVAHFLWCFKIADARGKTGLVGFLLWFPLTSFIAFLYLAFSNGAAPIPATPVRKRPIELMTLETA